MKLVALGDLIEPVTQSHPASLGREWIEYVDISTVDRGRKQLKAPDRIRADSAPSRARQIVAADDVLVSTVRPNLNAVALVRRDYPGEVASTGFCVLRPRRAHLLPEYLYFFTRTGRFVTRLVREAVGATYPAVTESDVLETLIPLPSLPDQQRIAASLGEADNLCHSRQYGLELSASFLAVVFRGRFGQSLDTGPVTPLGELVEITGGGTPSRARLDYYEGDIPWLTSKDMLGDYIWDTEEHITPEAVAGSATKQVPADSVLLVVKSKVLMHRLPIAIAKVPLCHGQDIKSIQCDEGLHHEFARFVIKHHEQRLLDIARGANTEGLTLPMLEELPVPDIDQAEQNLFAELVDQYELVRSAQREALRLTEHLFQSLLRQAFDEQ